MTVETQIRITQALATIGEVWDETLDPPRAPGGGGGGGKPGSRAPLPDGAFDCRRHAAAVLSAWCVFVSDERGVCPVRLGEVAVLGMATWLAEQAAWMAEQDLGPVAALELTEAAKDLDAVAHPDRPDALYIGRCPVGEDVGTPCGARLYWPKGALTTDCPSCGTRDDVQGWLQRMGDELPDELTAVQLSTYLTRALDVLISHDLVRKWASRGVLTPLGHRDERRRPLYSAAAALLLAQAHVERSERQPPRRVTITTSAYAGSC